MNRLDGCESKTKYRADPSGIIGEAVESSLRNRLAKFVVGPDSDPIQLFDPETREGSAKGDWYGEHAGKWLCAASLALRRTGDNELGDCINAICDFLISSQEPDGYLGTYAANSPCRMTSGVANGTRSWDPWVHAWMILGLLEANLATNRDDVLAAAVKIGDLFARTFQSNPSELLQIGNHAGLSSAVVIHPLAALTEATGDPTYADLAQNLVTALDAMGTKIISGTSEELDIQAVGTGKTYQLCWVLRGMALLARVARKSQMQAIVEHWWDCINLHHLTPLGGPWGGIASHKEVFNVRGFFSPEGLTETCTTVSWIALCRELYRTTGNSKYVDAAEKAIFNALLGAMDSNGEDWCYFTFPNGRRNNTYYWACCKSSGAIGLEEATLWNPEKLDNSWVIHFWESFAVRPTGKTDHNSLRANLVRGETWTLDINLTGPADDRYEIRVRIPAWGQLDGLLVSGVSAPINIVDGYLHVAVASPAQIQVSLRVPLTITSNVATQDHHGQEIVRRDYAYASVGPYVYATGLIDGYKCADVFRIAKLFPENSFSLGEFTNAGALPDLWLKEAGRKPVLFRPYYEAGGRHGGAWRTTWFEVAWQ